MTEVTKASCWAEIGEVVIVDDAEGPSVSVVVEGSVVVTEA